MVTLEQKIAQAKDNLARLTEQSRKLENGQKIITGGMSLSIARKNPERAKILLDDYKNEITKKSDLDRLQPVINELQSIVDKFNKEKQTSQHSEN